MKLHHLVFCVIEAFSDEVDGLVLRDRILLRGRDDGIERPDFRFFTQTIFQFSERRQQSRTVGLQLATLAAHAVLHREPVALRSMQMRCK